jgi:hypothetical protein
MFSLLTASAQCGIENKAFKSGEFLVYDLYFNWKFVWVKVGSASMSTMESRYAGKKVFRSSLTTRGNNKLDGIFVMRDTLLSYCDAATLAPVYFRKGALEGKRYYVDELWYSYPGNNCRLKMHRYRTSRFLPCHRQDTRLCHSHCDRQRNCRSKCFPYQSGARLRRHK